MQYASIVMRSVEMIALNTLQTQYGKNENPIFCSKKIFAQKRNKLIFFLCKKPNKKLKKKSRASNCGGSKL